MRSGEFTPFIIQKNVASLSPNIYVLQYLTNKPAHWEKLLAVTIGINSNKTCFWHKVKLS